MEKRPYFWPNSVLPDVPRQALDFSDLTRAAELSVPVN
jgi:hypothetical protein